MEFNSWLYLQFLVLVVLAYIALSRSVRLQNLLLLLASYAFYSAWDWRFLGLILISTFVDFTVGRRLDLTQNNKARRYLLALSLVVNLSLLGFFKYFNFFTAGFHDLLISCGFEVQRLALDIVLPVGISFYTFQTLSYTIDIYRRKLRPTKSLLNFALFVAYFPQLVAGPIERARNILPQLEKARIVRIAQFGAGFELIIWGLFKKVFVADNLALIADPLFNASDSLTASMTYVATLAFAFQIYADFSAYTDIARGTSRIFGIRLMENFRSPYLALNPQEFWRRWHVSLSTWLRDYLYIGLGGNRVSEARTYVNLAITMLLGGLWHGASWNFVWWGAYHGFLLAIHRFLAGRGWFKVPKPLAWFSMFHLTLFGWMLFRSTAQDMIDGVLVDKSGEQLSHLILSFKNGVGLESATFMVAGTVAFYAAPMFVLEWLSNLRTPNKRLHFYNTATSIVAISMIAFLIVRFGVQSASSFIYFQF